MEAPQRDNQCPAVARSGERCKKPVQTGSDFCEMHDPKAAERRRRIASKAGRHSSGPAREAAKIRRSVLAVMEEVRREDVKPQTAYAYSALGHVAISAIHAELKAIEQEDLTRRIERLEEIQEESGL